MKSLRRKNSSIWLCNSFTEEECLSRNLLGATKSYGKEKISIGDVCFLLNYTTDELLGPFVADSDPGYNLEPEAWRGSYPYQIRVKPIGKKVQRIPNAIKCFTAAIRLKIIKTKQGNQIPKYSVFGPEITSRILDLFETMDASEVPAPEQSAPLKMPPKVRFADVAGLDEVKKYIRERMIYPLLYPGIAQAYHLRTGGGLLLYGPPGTGKTLLARATAGEIDAEFYEISPSVVRGFPGEPEQHLEQIFQKAMMKPRCIVFIDEADALLAKRERIQASTVMQRVVPTLLSLFTRVRNKRAPVLIIAATNKPWDIDDAFLRPGRLDLRFEVPLPDINARVALLQLQLKERPINAELEQDNCLRKLAHSLDGWTGADIEQLIDRVAHEVARKVTANNPDIGQDPLEDISPSCLVPITMGDIEDGIRKGLASPSVSTELLNRLAEWKSRWDR